MVKRILLRLLKSTKRNTNFHSNLSLQLQYLRLMLLFKMINKFSPINFSLIKLTINHRITKPTIFKTSKKL